MEFDTNMPINSSSILQAEYLSENIGYPDYIVDVKYLTEQYKEVCSFVDCICVSKYGILGPSLSSVDIHRYLKKAGLDGRMQPLQKLFLRGTARITRIMRKVMVS